MSDKTKSEELKEQLFIKKKNGRLLSDEAVLCKADEFCASWSSESLASSASTSGSGAFSSDWKWPHSSGVSSWARRTAA